MDLKKGLNFSMADLGCLDELGQYSFKHPLLPNPVEGKKFLHDDLELTGMEVSIHKLLPGTSMPFYHRHRENEELYLFIKGRGEFQIDGEVMPVREGTVIRVEPAGVRAWRNNSSEDMYYIVVQAKAGSLGGYTATDGIAAKEKVSWPEQGS